MDSYQLPILIYDDKCTLCRRFKEGLERLPGAEAITMVSIDDSSIYDQFPQLNPEECFDTAHYINEEGVIFQGSDIPSELVKQFPAVSKFAWLIQSGMGKKAMDFFYSMANHYRESSLNNCDDCKKKRIRKQMQRRKKRPEL